MMKRIIPNILGIPTQQGALLNQNKSILDGDTFDNGKLLFTIDDGLISAYETVFPLLQSKGIKATFVIPYAQVGQPGRVSWAQLNEIEDAGHTIAMHPGFNGLNETQILAAVNAHRTAFTENGLKDPKYLGYSDGYYNNLVINTIDDLIVMGRAVSAAAFVIGRKDDKYTLASVYLGNPTAGQMAGIKTQIDLAKAQNKAVTIYLHDVNEAGGGVITSIAQLTEIIDYAISAGVECENMEKLYSEMLYINLRVERISDTQIDLAFPVNFSTDVSIERSVDGVNYAEIEVVESGTINYSDIGLNINTTYYYRVRAVDGTTYLPYSRVHSASTAFTSLTLAKTGDGSAVSKLRLTLSENTSFKIVGSAKFYTDSAGTANESDIWEPTAGIMKETWIRATGNATVYVSKNTITSFTSWGGVVSETNAPSLGGDISKFTNCNNIGISGNNTCNGNIALMPVVVSANIASNNTFSGSISGKTTINLLALGGSNTISGDGSTMTNLYYYISGGNCTITWPNVTNLKALSRLRILEIVLTSENVNQILADMWLNRNETKPVADRVINLTGATGTGAPTGQGITDKANLISAGWTVTTR